MGVSSKSSNKIKKYSFAFVLILFFLSFPFFSNAQRIAPRPLEIEYPPFPHIAAPTETVTLPNYIRYIYYFALGISGLVALGVLVWAGFRYLVSAGRPEVIKDAKDRMTAALLGMLILFCSWLILRTINPELVILRPPGEIPSVIPALSPGVYLCRERVDILGFESEKRKAELMETSEEQRIIVAELQGILETINEHCHLIANQGNLLMDFEDKVNWVYLVPSSGKQQYGVMLYEESYFGGRSSVLYGDGEGNVEELQNPSEWPIQGFLVSSVRPFILNFHPSSSWYVKLYKSIYFNRDDPSEQSLTHSAGQINGADVFDVIPEIGSLKIEGKLIVVFFKDPPGEGGSWGIESITDIFSQSDSNLNDNLMGIWLPDQCVERREPTWRDRYYPCAHDMIIISGGTY